MLTEMPLGFSVNGMATRCPVQYVLRCDPTLHEPKVRFQGTPVDTVDLPKTVQAHMRTIQGISGTVVEVLIQGPRVKDMVFVDLPGLNVLGGERDIRDLVVSYMRRPNAFGVVVVPPGDQEIAANMGIAACLRLAEESGVPRVHEKFLVLINKCDTMASWLQPGGTKMDSQLFKPLHEINNNFMFICLNPTAADLDEHSFADRAKFLQDIPRLEQAFFTEKLFPNLERKYPGRFGVKNVQNVMSQRLRDHFMPQVDDMLHAMVRNRIELEDSIEALQASRDDCHVPAAEGAIDFFVETLFNTVKKGGTSETQAMNLYDVIDTTCVTVGLSGGGAQVSVGGRTGAPAEDGGFGLSKKWRLALDRERLTDKLTTKYDGSKCSRAAVPLLNDFDRKMTGIACFKQARTYIEVCALTSPFRVTSAPEIMNIGLNSMSGAFDVTEVVKHMTHQQMDELIPGLFVPAVWW